MLVVGVFRSGVKLRNVVTVEAESYHELCACWLLGWRLEKARTFNLQDVLTAGFGQTGEKVQTRTGVQLQLWSYITKVEVRPGIQ